VRLIDAPRCPYCARVRIVLAEKGIEYETVEIDLSSRPAWVYDLNVTGRVPILDDDGFVLPESEVIMAYLDERFPDPPLLPADLRRRAEARLRVHRFDRSLGDDYYAFRRGDKNELAARLEGLQLDDSLYADIAFVPWIIRARDMLGVELPARLAGQLSALEERPSVSAEVAVVRAL
jgi:glutathione S-transferase-like protein